MADWTFEPERGGLLGHTHREADVTRLTTRFRDAGDEVDDLWVLELRQPYPSDGYELIRRGETVSGLPEGEVEMIAVYEVRDGLIRTVRFARQPA